MGRVKRELKRPSDKLKSSLCIIATEGANTEFKYFTDLTSKENYYNSNVHIVILPAIENKSAPTHVIKTITSFSKEYELGSGDELWLVIDRDKWPTKNISNIARQCQQKKFNLCVSNPCFELWLLLHFLDVQALPHNEKELLFQNKKVSPNRTEIEKRLLSLLGSYNKSNIDTSVYLPHTHLAISRAKKIDKDKKHRWPNYLATRIYRIIEKII